MTDPFDDTWDITPTDPGYIHITNGTGTTLAVASGHGRDSISIDLDPRNADLARQRVGMFLDINEPPRPPTPKGGKVAGVEPIDVRSDLL